MKKILLAVIASGFFIPSFSQDSTQKERADTIKIGGMVIIKKEDKNDTAKNKNIVVSHRNRNKNTNLQTNWFIIDLGFANYNDNTNYASAEAQAFAPSGSKDQLELRNGKSVNVNFWAFMQKLNIIKHIVNLKYGLGVELNNYHFDDERVQLLENPTKIVLNPDWARLKKNKLAADYVTLPMLLNLNLTPKRNRGFGISGGVSAGYLYSARQKIKDGDNRNKTHDNFDLRKWKISYIGELSLGPIKLYGSYASKSMWEKGLDQTPYNVGLRFSRF
jgi:hypothetical protein